FSHRPATVGSAALLGSAALVSITTPAMSNIDSRVFNGVSPLREVYGHRLTICPFQGHSACNQGLRPAISSQCRLDPENSCVSRRFHRLCMRQPRERIAKLPLFHRCASRDDMNGSLLV